MKLGGTDMAMTGIIQAINGVLFGSLFGSRDDRLVKWALPGEYIPLQCSCCKATFITHNVGPLGSKPLIYGSNLDKSRQCEQQYQHNLLQLVPSKKLYNSIEGKRSW